MPRLPTRGSQASAVSPSESLADGDCADGRLADERASLALFLPFALAIGPVRSRDECHLCDSAANWCRSLPRAASLAVSAARAEATSDWSDDACSRRLATLPSAVDSAACAAAARDSALRCFEAQWGARGFTADTAHRATEQRMSLLLTWLPLSSAP